MLKLWNFMESGTPMNGAGRLYLKIASSSRANEAPIACDAAAVP